LSRREVAGMRKGWSSGLMGMMTVLRVLPADLYDRLVHSPAAIAPGQLFEETMRRKRA